MNSYPDPGPQEYLLGYLSYEGIKQQSPQYWQGPDINITAVLVECGKVVNYDDYTSKVVLKENVNDDQPVWVGYPNHGLFKANDQVLIKIPGNISCQLEPGIYYVAIVGNSKTDVNHTAILYESNFSVELSAASGPPRLSPPTATQHINPVPNEGVFVPIAYINNG